MPHEPHKFEIPSRVLGSGDIVHYTCNTPCQEILDQYNIREILDDENNAASDLTANAFASLPKNGFKVL